METHGPVGDYFGRLSSLVLEVSIRGRASGGFNPTLLVVLFFLFPRHQDVRGLKSMLLPPQTATMLPCHSGLTAPEYGSFSP